MTDPQGMAKLNLKGTVGTIYTRDHNTLLETKYIDYGPLRKYFKVVFFHYKSMRAIDHQFARKGLDWQDLRAVALDVAIY